MPLCWNARFMFSVTVHDKGFDACNSLDAGVQNRYR